MMQPLIFVPYSIACKVSAEQCILSYLSIFKSSDRCPIDVMQMIQELKEEFEPDVHNQRQSGTYLASLADELDSTPNSNVTVSSRNASDFNPGTHLHLFWSSAEKYTTYSIAITYLLFQCMVNRILIIHLLARQSCLLVYLSSVQESKKNIFHDREFFPSFYTLAIWIFAIVGKIKEALSDRTPLSHFKKLVKLAFPVWSRIQKFAGIARLLYFSRGPIGGGSLAGLIPWSVRGLLVRVRKTSASNLRHFQSQFHGISAYYTERMVSLISLMLKGAHIIKKTCSLPLIHSHLVFLECISTMYHFAKECIETAWAGLYEGYYVP